LETAQIIELALLAVMVATLAVLGFGLAAGLKRIERVADQAESFLKQTQEELAATLQQTHLALERVERLAQSTDVLVRQELAPTLQAARATLGHVESTTRAISSTAGAVSRVASTAGAVASPAGLGSLAVSLLRAPGGKAALAILGVGAGLRALLSRDGHAAGSKRSG